MPFEVRYNRDLHCLVNILTGDLDQQVIGDYFSEVGKVAEKNKCTRMISDLREAKIIAPVTEMYNMLKSLEAKKIKITFRRALVISQDKENYEFWETASVNHGFQSLKLFEDYDEALKWMLEK